MHGHLLPLDRFFPAQTGENLLIVVSGKGGAVLLPGAAYFLAAHGYA
jgi:hypothetical protein